MTSSVVSPFLNEVSAAAELGTIPLNVRRLAARGVLKASWVGGDALRILPNNLSAYASAGCPDFVMPPVEPNGGFLTEGAYGQVGRLDRDIREALAKIAEDMTEAPPTADVLVPIAGTIAAIVSGEPYRSLARMAGTDYTPPFRTRAEGFAVVFLRTKVVEQLMNSRSRTGGAIDVLYRTQTTYRDAVNAAWESWGQQSFTARRTFPVAGAPGRPVTVAFRVPYSALGVDQQRVTQLAF